MSIFLRFMAVLYAHDFGFYGKVRSPWFAENRVYNLSIFWWFMEILYVHKKLKYGFVRSP